VACGQQRRCMLRFLRHLVILYVDQALSCSQSLLEPDLLLSISRFLPVVQPFPLTYVPQAVDSTFGSVDLSRLSEYISFATSAALLCS
jgi:hypothetical protein